MSRKLSLPLIVLVLIALVLNACAPAATPTVAPTSTTAPVVVEPTATPEPTVAPDVAALWNDLIASLPADKGYGLVSAAKLNEELAEKAPFLLDVREAAELEKDGYIEGAVHIPVRQVLDNLDKLPPQDQPIVVYCASGHRGAFVMASLKLLGYTNVRNLAGGLGAWKKAELPVVTGSMPEAPKAGTAPEIKDQALYELLKGFFTSLPDGFYSIKADKLNTELAEGKAYNLIDVRREDEFQKNGYIAGAVNLPMETLFASLDKLPAKDAPIVIYCASGHRGAIVAMGLRLLGYTNVINLVGGINAWKAAGFPLEGVVDWNALWGDFLTNLPENFYTITAANLNSALVEKAPFLLDVREAAELEKDGYIEGAVHIPVRQVLDNLDKLPAQDQPIVVYCGSGHRGAFVMAALRFLGYTDVVNLVGGLNAWKKAELPVVTGSMPEAPKAGTAPQVDALRLEGLKAFFAGLPEGFGTIKAGDLNAALGEATKPFILDVRTEKEYTEDGHIEGSVHIPINTLWANLDKLPAKDARIVVLCKSGHRGALAMMALRMNGYTDVVNLLGGTNAWVAAELPLVK
ncbi:MULTISPECIES: rhodanese-like domain-containing protein [Anaerolinea]|uniref:rhodanese-like domain-containing protein n=2 Tax=Anaerolineaceae TaxID=292628 RepID=UPI0026F140CA|nr:rhodanese-like domain-containing protein [Anaerolinea thermophila]